MGKAARLSAAPWALRRGRASGLRTAQQGGTCRASVWRRKPTEVTRCQGGGDFLQRRWHSRMAVAPSDDGGGGSALQHRRMKEEVRRGPKRKKQWCRWNSLRDGEERWRWLWFQRCRQLSSDQSGPVVTGVRWGPSRAVVLREKQCEGGKGGDGDARPFLMQHGDMGRWWGLASCDHATERSRGGPAAGRQHGRQRLGRGMCWRRWAAPGNALKHGRNSEADQWGRVA
jgi:hypothetical protein